MTTQIERHRYSHTNTWNPGASASLGANSVMGRIISLPDLSSLGKGILGCVSDCMNDNTVSGARIDRGTDIGMECDV